MTKIGLKASDIDYGVGVLTEGNGIQFVTDFTVYPSVAHWDSGKKACLMSKDDARHIALGLCSHGTMSVVVEIPKFMELANE